MRVAIGRDLIATHAFLSDLICGVLGLWLFYKGRLARLSVIIRYVIRLFYEDLFSEDWCCDQNWRLHRLSECMLLLAVAVLHVECTLSRRCKRWIWWVPIPSEASSALLLDEPPISVRNKIYVKTAPTATQGKMLQVEYKPCEPCPRILQ